MLFPYRLTLATSAFISNAVALHATDSYTDADIAQSSYLPNHNIDPTVLAKRDFALTYTVRFNIEEQFYAEPLVYTPNGRGQLIFLASSQNWIRILDAKTGEIINARQVQRPFLNSDVNSTAYGKTLGISGTPVLDPNTDIVYFFAKSYIPNLRAEGETGAYNGVFYFHGVDINTFEDVPGFPILLDGYKSDNDPNEMFIGGLLQQDPSLVQVDDLVYGGFGGHSGSLPVYKDTALVVGVNVISKQVVTDFSVPSNLNSNGQGPFTSGMALSTNGSHLFLESRQRQPGTAASQRRSLVQDENFVSPPQLRFSAVLQLTIKGRIEYWPGWTTLP